MDRAKRTMMVGMAIAAPLTAAVWWGVYEAMPAIPDVGTPFDRFVFALKCCAVAVLLTFFLGIEAVAHERLQTPAIDPLAGAESRRLKINLRYLQNTLEQLMLFIPGLLALSQDCDTPAAMRIVPTVTVVWILARFVFWIGYHRGPEYRAPGLVGLLQSALVLLYVGWRFGGWPVPALVLGGELYLVSITSRKKS